MCDAPLWQPLLCSAPCELDMLCTMPRGSVRVCTPRGCGAGSKRVRDTHTHKRTHARALAHDPRSAELRTRRRACARGVTPYGQSSMACTRAPRRTLLQPPPRGPQRPHCQCKSKALCTAPFRSVPGLHPLLQLAPRRRPLLKKRQRSCLALLQGGTSHTGGTRPAQKGDEALKVTGRRSA